MQPPLHPKVLKLTRNSLSIARKLWPGIGGSGLAGSVRPSNIRRHKPESSPSSNTLLSAFVVGSASGTGFIDGVSNVSMALILEDSPGKDDARHLRTLVEEVRSVLDQGDNLVVQCASVKHAVCNIVEGANWSFSPLMNAVERYELLIYGRPLWGMDVSQLCENFSIQPSIPTYAELAEATVQFASDRFGLTSDDVWHLIRPEGIRLTEHGPRKCSQHILYPVRFMYTLATGEVASTDSAVHWFQNLSDVTPAEHKLLRVAMQVRVDGLKNKEALEDVEMSIQLGLLPLWRRYVKLGQAVLRSSEDITLLSQLQKLERSLDEVNAERLKGLLDLLRRGSSK